jgi:methylglutaconyl-CoA hydratase
MKPYVKSEVINGCGEVEFYHPKSNSLPHKLLSELSLVIEKLGADHSVRCILLKSRGEKTFCAGASFDELINIKDEVQGKQFFLGFAKLILAIKNVPKLVVTIVQGKVVGGGIGLICASDYVIAHESASLKLSELSLGIGPFVIAPVLKRKLGIAHFMNMSLNPKKWKSSYWGLDRGIYSEISSTKEEMGVRIEEYINDIKEYSSKALCEIKTSYWVGFDNLEEEMNKGAEKSGSLVLSDYSREILKQMKFK